MIQIDLWPQDPPANCQKCARLVAFRRDTQSAHPDWYNGAVGTFGGPGARLLIVGLAPGLQGANRTGRPFTGDYAGDLLYATLLDLGLASGTYDQRADDGLRLRGCAITNAVRCVPPANKPVGAEIISCNTYLAAILSQMPNLKAVLALGRIAHEAVLRAQGLRLSQYPFGHGVAHVLPSGLHLHASYHCSRYNTNTRRLTEDMFRTVMKDAKKSAGL